MLCITFAHTSLTKTSQWSSIGQMVEKYNPPPGRKGEHFWTVIWFSKEIRGTKYGECCIVDPYPEGYSTGISSTRYPKDPWHLVICNLGKACIPIAGSALFFFLSEVERIHSSNSLWVGCSPFRGFHRPPFLWSNIHWNFKCRLKSMSASNLKIKESY